MSPLPDPFVLANILRDVAARKPLALAQLYRAVAGRLYAVALGVTGHASHAEAVLERTFIDLWQGSDIYPGQLEEPLAWLGRLVRARALAAIGNAPLVSLDDSSPGQAKPDWSGISFLPDPPALRPFARLPEEQRRAILLAYGLAPGYDELADRLNSSLAKAQSNLRRALLTLAQDECRDKDDGR